MNYDTVFFFIYTSATVMKRPLRIAQNCVCLLVFLPGRFPGVENRPNDGDKVRAVTEARLAKHLPWQRCRPDLAAQVNQ